MTLEPGRRLGGFAIVSLIGKGGMGEVYRARDAKLGRDVAIKVLPEQLRDEPQRFARLRREASVLASLNHPGIASIYGLEEAEGRPFLVLELAEGQDLAERLKRGALPIDEAIAIARQIAEALEEAHERGVVHRDLKPANVKVARDGAVKVLDFGLAKALADDPEDDEAADVSASPTMTAEGTRAGFLLGTAPYMSPEQAKAKPVDRRADIWAFGVVLYEMLTGRRPFGGESTAEVLASVIKDDADLSALPKTTPPHVRALVERCLLRDPRERLRDIGEARYALARPPEPEASQKRARVGMLGIAAMGLLLGAGVTYLALGRAEPPTRALAAVHAITANPVALTVTGIAISGDGQYVAVADPRGLWMHLLATGEMHRVPLPEGFLARDAWWFPSQPRLLVLGGRDAARELWTVQPFGGEPRKVRDEVFTAAISPRGDRIAVISASDEGHRGRRVIWLMGADGSDARRFLEASPGESFWQLAWSPDAQRLAYGNWASDRYAIETRRVEDGGGHTLLVSDRRLFQSWTGILPFVWGPDGRLIYGRREEGLSRHTSNLWSISTDPASGEAYGEPSRLTQLAVFNVRSLSVTAAGTQMAALLVQSQADVYIGTLDATGALFERVERVTFDGRDDYPGDWSPDGARLLFESRRTGRTAVFEWDRETGSSRLVFEGPGWSPVSAPDGTHVLIKDDRGVLSVPAAGGPPRRLVEDVDAIRCRAALGSECVVGRRDGSEYVLSYVDLVTRRSREGVRFPYRAPFTKWALSPDGSRVAVVHNDDDVVTVIELATGERTPLTVPGWKYFEFLTWSATGERIYLNAGSSGLVGDTGRGLIALSFDGRVDVLRAEPHEWSVDVVASPDGRHLAYASMTFHGNAFLVHDF